MSEDLKENTYTNEAYKQYLTSDRQDYVHQNTKVGLVHLPLKLYLAHSWFTEFEFHGSDFLS